MANIIGLTGQTGAGKSTVRDLLEKEGMAVIDADSVSHGITENDLNCIVAIVDRFSVFMLNEKGTINRKALGRRVFSDSKELLTLNKIIFPYITKSVKQKIEACKAKGAQNIVIDGATIIESDCVNLCNTVISVVADEETRVKRIIKRDGITETDAKRRVSSQKPDEFYTEKSDFVIRNDGSEEELRKNVNSVLKNMLNR